MIDNNNPDIDVSDIMAKIHAEIANRGKATNPDELLHQSQLSNTDLTVDWANVSLHLSIAEQNANIGNRQLQMTQFPRPVRWLARMTGRAMMYFSQVLTISQRKFNLSLLQAMKLVTRSVKEVEPQITRQDERLTDVETRLQAQETERNDRLLNLETEVAELRGVVAEVTKTADQLRNGLVMQEHRLGILLEEARKRLPEPFDEHQLQQFVDVKDHLEDSWYFSLEERFRGSRGELKERLSVYLPTVKEANAGGPDRLILDLGCGRGEWLELLKEEKLTAQGVDIKVTMVEECRQRGLDVIQDDVFDYLESLPDENLGGITAFHLVEHLPHRFQIKLLNEMVRILKSGGIAILETPNPENLQVGSCNFYLDPTHQQPLPPLLARFMAEQCGLCRVEMRPLHPYGRGSMIPQDGSELAARVNHLFYGPQDYALIGYKV